MIATILLSKRSSWRRLSQVVLTSSFLPHMEQAVMRSMVQTTTNDRCHVLSMPRRIHVRYGGANLLANLFPMIVYNHTVKGSML